MQTKSDYDNPWGGAEDMRALAAEAHGSLDFADIQEPDYEPASPEPGHPRRLLRTSLWISAYAAAAIALFLGGWFAHAASQSGSPSSSSPDELAQALFPESGVTLDVSWGDIPQRLVQEGVIDLDKFTSAAQRAGSPLTPDQLMILREGSDGPLTVDASNAYFVLDVLWALGLANENAILTEGPIAERGWDQAGNYASTGGWTIGKDPGPNYLATLDLVRLTPEQQAVLNDVAFNSYRPCCGNVTAFPDCNHGMAALALAELMASQGAGANEIFQALKDVSPFWFPNQYYQLALFFEHQGQEWDKVDSRVLMSRDYSSGGGWQQVSAYLQQEGILDTGRPGEGKASGCAA
jgi:hypothetical protein